MKSSKLLHIVLCLVACSQLFAQEVSSDSIKKLSDEAFELARSYSFGKALSYSYLAIQYATNNEDDTSLAYSYSVLGRTYDRMQYRDKAKKYYQKTLKIEEELGNKRQIVLVYHDLVRISQKENDFEKVHLYLQEGYKVANASGDFETILVLDWAKISILQAEKKYEELLRHVNEMEVRVKKVKSKKIMYTARINYLEYTKGGVYYHLGDYEKAQKFLEKHTTNEYTHAESLATSYMQLAKIYKSKGEVEKQRLAQLDYEKNLKKKLDKDRDRLQEELLANYSLRKDQLKLDKLEEKNQQKTVIVNRFKMVLGIIILLLIGCIILGTLIVKAIYKKIRSNKLLRIKHNKLEEAKLKAEMTSKTKLNFFSMMSHELRTPLYAVTGITHLLLEENPKPSQQQYLKSLKFSGDHLLSLVNNILQANKLEDNTITI